MTVAGNLGELKASGYPDRSVKDELRTNLLARLSSGDKLFPSIVGYDDSVIPSIERAVLAGHDVIVLGERGQAKSRIMRYLAGLLDEHVPAIAGCEVNDHPYHPICARCRELVAREEDATPIEWVHRDLRYSEKLATPDVSVADLIGDVDPIRVAEGRYLGDELTIHYGLVPRTNRGILALNELPDLPERIQVSLLNILEERDIQIRGYKIRLPLDLMLIASANPEDYTHRGRIITPLKDRFGTQVRTHYPQRVEDEVAIMEQEARPAPEGIPIYIPGYLKEVVAAFAALLRTSPQVNQRSGVSVRFSIGALETIVASALRRAVINNEPEAVPRPSDLQSIVHSSIGRIEFDTLEEGREHEILERALKEAVLEIWQRHATGEDLAPVLDAFDEGLSVEVSGDMGSDEFLRQLPVDDREVAAAFERVQQRLKLPEVTPAARASALEFCLEALHLNRRLNKTQARETGRVRFAAPSV
ncbi:MAG TPA: sigma 54-interacting transcriptional regulator [Actinomycetota bacterium]|nr:sigma 54-interacting transcriptional regulator [Actinomycetota bacterium]